VSTNVYMSSLVMLLNGGSFAHDCGLSTKKSIEKQKTYMKLLVGGWIRWKLADGSDDSERHSRKREYFFSGTDYFCSVLKNLRLNSQLERY
jgi:hypothetical protein